jgi:dTDP-glucose 4,6-dehydratase
VGGFLAALNTDAGVGETVNLGTGFEISIGAVADLIARIAGRSVEWAVDEARLRPAQSEVERLCADNSKARALLGWVPEYSGVTGVERGLRKTIEWFADPDNLKQYRANRYNV